MSLFVRADNTMLTNYVFPMIHPYNCVPSTLKLLQYLNSEDADILSEIAIENKYGEGSGIPMIVVVEILKQITGNESINIACGPTFSIDEPEYKSFEYTFDNTKEPITKIGNSPIKWISKLDKNTFQVIGGEDTPKDYVNYLILSIVLDGTTLKIYDDLKNTLITWPDLLSFFKDIDFRGKTIKVNFISDSGKPIKLIMKYALKIYNQIPNGCLAIGKVEIDNGYITLGDLRVKSLPSEHVIILGKSINGNPYMIDPQTSDIYREGNFASGVYEIFEYIKTMNINKVCMIYSNSGGCKQININSIEEGQQPVENFLSRQGSLFDTQSSDDSFEINRLDLEDVQRRLETLERRNPLVYQGLSTGNKIKIYLDSLAAASEPAEAPAPAPAITMTETKSDSESNSDSSGGYSRSSHKLKTNLRKNNKYKKTCKKKTRKKKTRKKKTRKKKHVKENALKFENTNLKRRIEVEKTIENIYESLPSFSDIETLVKNQNK